MAGALSGNQFWDGLHNTARKFLVGGRSETVIYLLEEIASLLSAPAAATEATLSLGYTVLAGAGTLTTIPAGARSVTIHNSGPDPLPGSWGDDLTVGLEISYTCDAPFEVLPAITFTAPVGTTVEYAFSSR